MKLAPIVLFAYKRPSHTQKTIESLLACNLANESELFVFSDGPKNEEDKAPIKEVREYLHSLNKFKKIIIIENQVNKGLAKNIIEGVTQILNNYNSVIVLEDDLEFSVHFLDFLNNGLDIYKDNSKVMQISGHMYNCDYPDSISDTFFLSLSSTLGWATWKRSWEKFDHDLSGFKELEKNKVLKKQFNINNNYPFFELLQKHINNEVSSWGVVWYLTIFINKGLVLYPKRSFVKHVGFDETATHAINKLDFLAKNVSTAKITNYQKKIDLDKGAMKSVLLLFSEFKYMFYEKKTCIGLRVLSKIKKISHKLYKDTNLPC